jgi:hypothetical protein
MMNTVRREEPHQAMVEDQPMGDVLRMKFFPMGQTFNSRSDSPDSLAVAEVYCV